MGKFFSKEIQTNEDLKQTAGFKARDDADLILANNDWKELTFAFDTAYESKGAADTLRIHRNNKKVWKDRLEALGNGDALLVQFPVKNHSIFLSGVFTEQIRKGVKVILLIHDLETIRAALRQDTPLRRKIRLNLEEGKIMRQASAIIVHNEAMKELLIQEGFAPEKLVVLEMFDYLIPDYDARKDALAGHFAKDLPVIVAGNLRRHKAEYVYHLPTTQEFNLYGVGYEDQKQMNIHYQGSFDPDELPFALQGSFGLVWDGDSADTCSGVYGQYLKVNNPHKCSLYLATGMPVIVWKESAVARIVEREHLGIAVNSLHEIPERIKELSEMDYANMQEKVRSYAQGLRNGEQLKKALVQALQGVDA